MNLTNPPLSLSFSFSPSFPPSHSQSIWTWETVGNRSIRCIIEPGGRGKEERAELRPFVGRSQSHKPATQMADFGSGSLRSLWLSQGPEDQKYSVTMHYPPARPVSWVWDLCRLIGPVPGRAQHMLQCCCHHLEILHRLGKRSPMFAFCTGLGKLPYWSCFLLSFKAQPFGRWDCFLPLPVEDPSFVSPEAYTIMGALFKKKDTKLWI